MALVLLGGCASSRLEKPIPLAEPAPAEQRQQEREAPQRSPVLRVAVSSMLSPRETLRRYIGLLAYLKERGGTPTELIQRHTYAETNEVVRRHGCDLAFVCTYAYVRGEKEFGMEALAAPQIRGSATYRCYLIVPGDSAARSLRDLRGKVFAFTDPLSHTGYLFPLHLLRQLGEKPGRFFARTLFTYSHDNSIASVRDGLVDGAAVDSLVYEELARTSPQKVLGTKVICRSPGFGAPPVVVPPGMRAESKHRLQHILLTMHLDTKGREVLEGMGIERFVKPDPRGYDLVRSIARQVEGRL